MDVSFRDADASEDGHLSRILYNAFLPIWNHNWFQCISKPLTPIATVPAESPTSSLSSLQRARLAFYLSLIKTTRLLGGSVTVAHAIDDASQVAAILLFLPPHRRATLSEFGVLYNSGLLSAVLGYGLRGVYRVLVAFEGNVERMLKSGLAPLGWSQEKCGFVQMIARNPDWNGERGAAGRLLDMQVQKHEASHPGIPVVLDTTTVTGVRVYERIGFKEIGSCPVDTGTDELGIATSDQSVKKSAQSVTIQRVMVRLPEEAVAASSAR